MGVQLPTVEVRYENVTVQAQAHIAKRALPTLINVARNTIEGWLDMVGIPLARKTSKTILQDVSGVIKPGRMTLLLGPPASGELRKNAWLHNSSCISLYWFSVE